MMKRLRRRVLFAHTSLKKLLDLQRMVDDSIEGAVRARSMIQKEWPTIEADGTWVAECLEVERDGKVGAFVEDLCVEFATTRSDIFRYLPLPEWSRWQELILNKARVIL